MHQSTICEPDTSFDFDFTLPPLLQDTHNGIEFLCLSTNLERKKKEEVKYAWHCAFCKKTTEMASRVVL